MIKMTDLMPEGEKQMSNVKRAIVISKAKTKDINKLTKVLQKKLGLTKPSSKPEIVKSIIKELISEGYLKSTKDAYILTKKSKEIIESWKRLKKMGVYPWVGMKIRS